MRIFWEKNVKKSPQRRGLRRWPPAAGGSAPRPPRCYFPYYYNFVKFISSAKNEVY